MDALRSSAFSFKERIFFLDIAGEKNNSQFNTKYIFPNILTTKLEYDRVKSINPQYVFERQSQYFVTYGYYEPTGKFIPYKDVIYDDISNIMSDKNFYSNVTRLTRDTIKENNYNNENVSPSVSRTEEAAPFSIKSVRSRIRNRSNLGPNFLFYPKYMKDDTSKNKGQDRIKFSVFTLKRLDVLKDLVVNTDILKQQATQQPPAQDGSPTYGSTEELYYNDELIFQGFEESRDESKKYRSARLLINEREISSVFLSIQDKIQDSNSVSWSSGSLNVLERFAANLSYSLMENPDKTVGKAIDSLEQIGRTPGMKTLGKLKAAEVGTGIGGLFNRATGAIFNPNIELLFQNPELRDFTFNFKLSPRDEDEAADVKSIIKFFKKGMAPRVSPETGGEVKAPAGTFLLSPLVFKIEYLHGANASHKSLNLIKMCALRQCTVDYTPNNSYMTYNDNEATMVSYSINLAFQEIMPVYDIDYDETDKDNSIGY